MSHTIHGKISVQGKETVLTFQTADLKTSGLLSQEREDVCLTPLQNGSACLHFDADKTEMARYMELYEQIEEQFHEALKELADK